MQPRPSAGTVRVPSVRVRMSGPCPPGPEGNRAPGTLGSAPVIAPSDGHDPRDHEQQRQDQAPHEPAAHRSPLSVECADGAVIDAPPMTLSVGRISTPGLIPRGRASYRGVTPGLLLRWD